MTRALRITAVLVSLIASGVLFTQATSQAFAKAGGTRPGWGFGDPNHEHTGPPGQSTAPLPGNGPGHSGPPGHS